MPVLNSKQSGSIALSGVGSATATISSVDTTKTIVHGMYSESGGANARESGMIDLTNATTITAYRNDSAGDLTMYYTALEFTSGVTVQRGSILSTDWVSGTGIYYVNKTITSVGSNTIVRISAQEQGGALVTHTLVRPEITSATNVYFEVEDRNGAPGLTYYYEIIDFGSTATVTEGTVTIGATSTSATDTVSISDTDAAALFIGWQMVPDLTNPASQPDFTMVRGAVTNSTTLTFTRGNYTDGVEDFAIELTYYLVEFTDGTEVRHGSISIAGGSATGSDTFSAITVANSWASLIGYCGTRGSTTNTADDVGRHAAYVSSLTSTGITLTRGISTGDSVFEYQIIDFTNASSGGDAFLPKVLTY